MSSTDAGSALARTDKTPTLFELFSSIDDLEPVLSHPHLGSPADRHACSVSQPTNTPSGAPSLLAGPVGHELRWRHSSLKTYRKNWKTFSACRKIGAARSGASRWSSI